MNKNLRKSIILGLALSTTISVGSVFAKTTTDPVKNNSKPAEINILEKNTKDIGTKINKEKAIEIASKAFRKYFNVDLDVSKFARIEFNKELKHWVLADIRTVKNKGLKLDSAIALKQDGQIMSITHNGKPKNFDKVEEGKTIAKDFIKKLNIANNDSDISFLRVGNLKDLDFKYGKDEKTGKNKVIYISINPETKKVSGFTLELE